MTQCTLSYLSYNASILADTSSTKLCFYPQTTWAVFDTTGIGSGKDKKTVRENPRRRRNYQS